MCDKNVRNATPETLKESLESFAKDISLQHKIYLEVDLKREEKSESIIKNTSGFSFFAHNYPHNDYLHKKAIHVKLKNKEHYVD